MIDFHVSKSMTYNLIHLYTLRISNNVYQQNLFQNLTVWIQKFIRQCFDNLLIKGRRVRYELDNVIFLLPLSQWYNKSIANYVYLLDFMYYKKNIKYCIFKETTISP